MQPEAPLDPMIGVIFSSPYLCFPTSPCPSPPALPQTTCFHNSLILPAPSSLPLPPLPSDDEEDPLFGDSQMDMGGPTDKEKAVAGLPLHQLHLHGPASGASIGAGGGGPGGPVAAAGSGAGAGEGGGGGCAAGGVDEVGPDEMVLKFECQMYKSREDEYMVDIQVRG